jgi:hypothetical protein
MVCGWREEENEALQRGSTWFCVQVRHGYLAICQNSVRFVIILQSARTVCVLLLSCNLPEQGNEAELCVVLSFQGAGGGDGQRLFRFSKWQLFGWFRGSVPFICVLSLVVAAPDEK